MNGARALKQAAKGIREADIQKGIVKQASKLNSYEEIKKLQENAQERKDSVKPTGDAFDNAGERCVQAISPY
jgi:hypothetical protein